MRHLAAVGFELRFKFRQLSGESLSNILLVRAGAA